MLSKYCFIKCNAKFVFCFVWTVCCYCSRMLHQYSVTHVCFLSSANWLVLHIKWGWNNTREMPVFGTGIYDCIKSWAVASFLHSKLEKRQQSYSVVTEKSEPLIREKHGQLETKRPSPKFHDHLHSSTSLFCTECHLHSHRKSQTTNSSANNRI